MKKKILYTFLFLTIYNCVDSSNTTLNQVLPFNEDDVVWIDKELSKSLLNDTFVDILWGRAESEYGISNYEVYLDDTLYVTVDEKVNRISIINLEPNTQYKVEVLAVDYNGSKSLQNPIKYFTTESKRYADRTIIFDFSKIINTSSSKYTGSIQEEAQTITKISKIDENNLLLLSIDGALIVECNGSSNISYISDKADFHFFEIGYSSFDIDTLKKEIFFLYSNSPVNESDWNIDQSIKSYIYISKYNFEYTVDGCIEIIPNSNKYIYQQLLYWKSHTNGDIKVLDEHIVFSVGDNITYPGSVDPSQNFGKIFSFPKSTIIETDEEMNKYKIAMGLRNPYRFEIVENEVFVFDVGEEDTEEVNVFDINSKDVLDFGWPYYEGLNPNNTPVGNAGMKRYKFFNNIGDEEINYFDYIESFSSIRPEENFIKPDITYKHINNRCAIIGADTINLQVLNSESTYLIFADYCSGEIFINDIGKNSPDIIKIHNFSEKIFIYELEVINSNQILVSTSNGVVNLKIEN